MAESNPLPHVVLVGGEGIPSGVPRHICHLAAAFQDRARVTVLSDENHGGFDALVALAADHVVLPGLKSKLSLRHILQGWRGLTTYLKKSDADLVWVHPRLPSLLGRAALCLRVWKPRHQPAFTIHGLPFGKGHKGLASQISLLIERILLGTCPPIHLVFLSQDMADRMTRTVGPRILRRHTVHVLPNCSDLGSFEPAPRTSDRRLVMTGRAGWQKNYARAARVLAHLPDNFRLTLCGTGTDTAEFQDSIAQIIPDPVLRRITFAGPVLDVRPYLAEADAYLLTSRYEGTPIGTLEAFEAGLPIILSAFEEADALVASHPLGLMLTFETLAADAERIVDQVETFRTDPNAYRHKTRAVWQAHWSPQVFEQNSRELLERLRAP